MTTLLKSFIKTISITALLVATSAHATIVQFNTNMGNFEVNLTDEHTPETVANFLQYVDAGTYTDVIVHRLETNFVIQSGGYTYNADDNTVVAIESLDPVVNEPVFSNVRGTIAMAKLGNDPNSATNQWFFNVADNASNLDFQNQGFTVFGVVSEQGMEIIDSINKLKKGDFGGAFANTPMQSFPAEGETVSSEHLVIIESITVVDTGANTITSLPPMSTYVPSDESADGSSKSSGGSWYAMLLIAGLGLLRRKF
ncbi:peptidylprolyl isomerase [Thalassotalea maritima]|uniref:peptidylprolyl isomerase n=1 Tax=Thalassotalea maritima TaxID=3242416 RepID=UPI0035282B26